MKKNSLSLYLSNSNNNFIEGISIMKKIMFFMTVLMFMSAVTSCSKDSDSSAETTSGTSNGDSERNDSTPGDNDDDVIYMLPETRDITLTDEQKQIVTKSNEFSYSLYKAVAGSEDQKGKNLVMSPLSAMYVLGMLYDGATGDTEKEISSLLKLPSGSKALVNDFCQALMTQVPLTDTSVTLETANIVAAANDLQMAQQFKVDMQQYYMAETALLDFTKPTALQFLNSWCSEKTHGMIPEILDALDPATRMVLMNAVFFKATWTEKFNSEDTREETFTKENAQTTTIPMMHRKANTMYAPGDTYSTLWRPYGSGAKLVMMVMLPNKDKTVDDIISSLVETPWETQWQRNRERCEVDIKMPRFTAISDVPLNDIISQMGAPSIFSNKADFSLMTANNESLFVSLMKQKAAIDVSEEGTKASAVTIATMEKSALPPEEYKKIDFHADRPFVYVIHEISSGATFFIGTFRGE